MNNSIYKLTIALGTVLFCLNSSAGYSNLEPYISPTHDQEFFQEYNYFLKGENLNYEHLEASLKVLRNRQTVLDQAVANSDFRNDTGFHGKDKKLPNYTKSPNSEGAAVIAAAIASNQTLLELAQKWNSLTFNEKANAKEVLANFIILKSTVGDTIVQDTVLSKNLDQFKNWLYFYPSFNLTETRNNIASNIDPNTPNSTEADPADSAFWTKNTVEDYNPLNEKFMNTELLPPADESIVYDYDEMANGNPKIKTKVTYKNKEYKVTIRSGKEVHAQILTGHLARAVGYPAVPSVFRKKIILNLKKTTIDEFFAQWKNAHTDRSSFTNNIFGRIKIINASTIELNDVVLEAYPDKDLYVKGAPFRAGRNGFDNRREYRALLFYASLINWSDSGDQNIRLDLVRENKNDLFKPLVFLNDTGISLGSQFGFRNGAAVNEYAFEMANIDGPKLSLKYINLRHRPEAWKQTTTDDLKWIAARYARLSNEQIDAMIKASGFPEPVAELYKYKIKSRLMQMFKFFNLPTRISQEQNLTSLAKIFPRYINSKGQLTDQFDIDYQGQTFYNGERKQLSELLSMDITNRFFSTLKSAMSTPLAAIPTGYGLNGENSSKLQARSIESGVNISCLRKVTNNQRHGPNQLRYLRQDVCEVNLPLGYMEARKNVSVLNAETKQYSTVELPVGLFANYTLDLSSSFGTEKEASTFNASDSDLLKMFNLILRNSKQPLQPGQTFKVSSSVGLSLGGLGLRYNQRFYVDLNLYKKSWQKLNEFTLRRINEKLVEVEQNYYDVDTKKIGFDIQAFELGLTLQHSKEKSNLRKYFGRFDATKMNGAHFQQIIQPFEFDPTQNTKIAEKALFNSNLESVATSKKLRYGFLVYTKQSQNSDASIKIKTTENAEDSFSSFNSDNDDDDLNEVSTDQSSEVHAVKTDFLYTANWNTLKGRSVKNLWKNQHQSGLLAELTSMPFTPLAFAAKAKEKDIYVELVTSENGELRIFTELSIEKTDNYVKREDFIKNYLNYAGQVIGDRSYFEFFKADARVTKYSPVELSMNLQISTEGLLFLIRSATKENNFLKTVALEVESQINKKDYQKAALKIREFLVLASKKNTDWSLILTAFKSEPKSEKDYFLDSYISHALEPSYSAVFSQMQPLSPKMQGQFQGRRYFDQRRLGYIETMDY